jgi:hypothetical protein
MNALVVGYSILITAFYLSAGTDINDHPTYNKDGNPINCRAYIQTAVDGAKRGEYSNQDALAGIERNCGMNGWSWGRK